MPRLFRYKGQAQHERPYLLLTTHYSLLTTHYSPLTYQAQHERPYVGIIAQELPEELAPYCRFRSRLAAAEHAALQTGSQERGTTQQSDALQIATERQPAEELPAAAGLFSSAHSQGVQLGPVDDDSPPGEPPPPPAETAWLFLVDLSALQFVLLHTAKGLQQQAHRAAPPPLHLALAAAPTPPPSPLSERPPRHATPPSPRASPTPPPLSLAAGAEAAARYRDTASVTRPPRPRAPGESAGRGDGGRALVTCAAAAHQLRRPPALARLHGPPRAGSCSSRSCSSSSVNLLHYYSTTVVPNLL